MDQGSIPDQGIEDVILSAALATKVGLVTGVLFQVRFLIFFQHLRSIFHHSYNFFYQL
jgi:hypothetical protein